MRLFEVQGLVVSQRSDFADLPVAGRLASLCRSGATTSEKTGTWYFWAASKIAIASASEPAIGLSMKRRFARFHHFQGLLEVRAAVVGLEQDDVNFLQESAIEPTISIPIFWKSFVYCGIRSVLDLMSALPRG